MLLNFLNQDLCKPKRLVYMGAEGLDVPDRQDSQDYKKEAKDVVEGLDKDMGEKGKALTKEDIDKKYSEAKAKLDAKIQDLSAKGYLDQNSAENMAFVEEQMKALEVVKDSYVALLDGLTKEKDDKKEAARTDAKAKVEAEIGDTAAENVNKSDKIVQAVLEEDKVNMENKNNEKLSTIEEALDSGEYNGGIITDGIAYWKEDGVMHSKSAVGTERMHTRDIHGRYVTTEAVGQNAAMGTPQELDDALFNGGKPSASVDPNAGKGVETGTAKAADKGGEKREINKEKVREDFEKAMEKAGKDGNNDAKFNNDFYEYKQDAGEIKFKGTDGKNEASLRLQDVCKYVCPEAMQDGKVLTITKKDGKQIEATWDAGKKDFVDEAGKHVPILNGDKFKVKDSEKKAVEEKEKAEPKKAAPEKIAEKEPTNEEILQKAATETAQDWLERKIQGEVKNEDFDAEHLFVDEAVEAAEKGNNASNDLVERVQENMKQAIEKATGVKVMEEEYSEEKAKNYLSKIKEVTLHGVKYDINLSDKKSVESVVSTHINLMKGGVKIEGGEKKREGKEGLLSALKDVSAKFEEQMKPGNFEKYFAEQRGGTSALEAAVKTKIEGEIKGIASQTEAIGKNYLRPEDMAKLITSYEQTDEYVDLKIAEFVKNAGPSTIDVKPKDDDIDAGKSAAENVAGDNELSDETAGFMEEKLTKGEVKLVNEMEKKIPLSVRGPDVEAEPAYLMNSHQDKATEMAQAAFANEMAKNLGLEKPDANINDLSKEARGEFKDSSEGKIRYDITIKNPRAFAKQYLFNSQKIGPKARKS